MIFISLVIVVPLFVLSLYLRSKKHKKSIGFFHPYCSSGGGGERVLWILVDMVQKKFPDQEIIVYTGDVIEKAELVEKIKKSFALNIRKENLKLINIHRTRRIYEKASEMKGTLILQAILQVLMVIEGLLQYSPEVFYDSMGFAFTFPIPKLIFGCKVGCYVHYPFISTDMIEVVSSKTSRFNNDASVTSSNLKSKSKVIYYKILSKLYGLMGLFVDAVSTNSSWTWGHISKLWFLRHKMLPSPIVFPPVNTEKFAELRIGQENKRKPYILSVGQFRPEKDHELQLRSFQKCLQKLGNSEIKEELKLVLVGGTRNEKDEQRVQNLEDLAKKLKIDDKVVFNVNAPFQELMDLLGKSLIGLHCMWNEHFGICVVEYMAAGLIPLAHNSGGPKLDIVSKETGFLAETEEEYAEKMVQILHDYYDNDEEGMTQKQKAARERSFRFSDQAFVELMEKIFKKYLIN